MNRVLYISNREVNKILCLVTPSCERRCGKMDFSTKDSKQLEPDDEEETLGNQGRAKIVVTYGPKKLENVNVQQWVVANTHSFYTLLSELRVNLLAK